MVKNFTNFKKQIFKSNKLKHYFKVFLFFNHQIIRQNFYIVLSCYNIKNMFAHYCLYTKMSQIYYYLVVLVSKFFEALFTIEKKKEG